MRLKKEAAHRGGLNYIHCEFSLTPLTSSERTGSNGRDMR
jgi:hypothetical protein